MLNSKEIAEDYNESDIDFECPKPTLRLSYAKYDFFVEGFLSSYGWYDKLGVVKIPKSHIHQYREDSHRRVKSKGHAERAILFCFLAVARP